MTPMEQLFRFCHTVTIQNTKDGPTRNDLATWLCQKGLSHDFNYSVDNDYPSGDTTSNIPVSWTYFFDDPKLAVLFKLTWGGQ